ncbi:MAG: DUF1934 domain-containing protein [Acetivibrionales bacterium]|jgi:uncharacterized beta-barrel protein YwiB (DUF1934 family)
MNKDVIISVKGSQTAENQQDDILELVTEGKYYKKGETYYVSYNESEVTGMEGTTTTLKVDGDIVTLIRFGAVNSQFVFQKGQRHICHYDTAYGAFTIGVYANEVNVNINDSGGEIRVDYQLEIGNNRFGVNDFHMLIREAGNSNDKYDRQC